MARFHVSPCGQAGGEDHPDVRAALPHGERPTDEPRRARISSSQAPSPSATPTSGLACRGLDPSASAISLMGRERAPALCWPRQAGSGQVPGSVLPLSSLAMPLQLRAQVGAGRCLVVDSSLKAQQQVKAVLRHFNVRVTHADIFSRCQVSPEYLSRLRLALDQGSGSGAGRVSLVQPAGPWGGTAPSRRWFAFGELPPAPTGLLADMEGNHGQPCGLSGSRLPKATHRTACMSW
ncbi:hypothetical protein P7K49_002213 [Saguinus oedipus]|uniref:Uncharacterized protein n=1 Tax=Saguinus oedipus TaxID=9490 RepID=A0ABQ9WGP8_SAGOE|nr:hypothetical protein P7K49_002213 [Saguinus oedipus]